MFCGSCGAPLDEDASFCGDCGEPAVPLDRVPIIVTELAPEPVSPTPPVAVPEQMSTVLGTDEIHPVETEAALAATTVFSAAPVTTTAAMPITGSPTHHPSRGGRRSGILVAAGVCALAIVGGGVAFVVATSGDDDGAALASATTTEESTVSIDATSVPTAPPLTTAAPLTVPPTTVLATIVVPIGSTLPPAPGTTAPTISTTAVTTVAPGSSVPATTVPGDLGLATAVMTRPSCDDSYITIVGSAIVPDRYPEVVQDLLDQYPGSSYLRTDETCPSLRQDVDGAAIYVAYFGPFADAEQACAARGFGPADAYVRVLSENVAPTHVIDCD